MPLCSIAKGVARTGIVTGLLLAGSRIGLAGESIPVSSGTTAPVAAALPMGSATESQPKAAATLAQEIISLEPESPSAGADPAPGKDKSVWSRVPPVTPLPRVGWFPMPPTDPGYYSLRDVIDDNYREKPPKVPYPPVSPIYLSFFDADYRYLDDPNYTERDCFDALKRMHPCCDWMLDVGGEERVRYMHEEGGYARFTGVDNDYTLLRTRLYGDLWYRDIFRVYVEYIDAQISGNDLPPLAIDVNHSDLLNLFADLKVFELDDQPVYVRGGRQELLYGSGRLISQLDWANTRRTFQGVKGFWHSDQLDVDAFWVQPIIVNPTHFDSPDDQQQFAGLWTTYRPCKGQSVDLYYLYLDNTRPVATGVDNVKAGFNVSTFGSRYSGDYEHVLWDFEGMYQFGDWSNQGTSAGAYTTGLGYQLAGLPMDPTFWIYYDFASGDHHPGAAGTDHGTFNQLFPFGHYYLGWLDLVGRQNIEDLNGQLAFYPTHWITTAFQYHMFRLDSARDALYNSAGTALRQDPTGRAGTDVGDEIDLITNFHLSRHQDILLGYSKLYEGNFIRDTVGPKVSPELFYAQYSFKW